MQKKKKKSQLLQNKQAQTTYTRIQEFDKLDKTKLQIVQIRMIQAEISIYPMATKTTSASFYIARAIETIKNLENLRYEINSMGTILESNDIDVIYDASKRMTEAVHNLGIARVEVIIKIDSRKDKDKKMEEKVESIKKVIEG